MNRYKRDQLALAVTLALTANYSIAEENATTGAKNSGLERIEVTARRTVENLQKVPVSVTSLAASDIAESGITDVTDVQQYATNTTLQASRGTSSTLTAYVRGIGQQDPIWGYEPGVGVYVDDIYIARPQGGVMEILDVERIEVLRGPQGTLYGKNTIGGALKYITRKMDGDNNFDIAATFGDYGLNTYKASGQLSLLSNSLYIGGAIADINRDGFGKFKNDSAEANSVAAAQAGKENYNKDILASRLTIEYHPNDSLFFRFAYDKTIDDSNAKGGYRLNQSVFTMQQPHNNLYDSDISLPVTNKVETSGISFTIDWILSKQFNIKSVTSHREGDTLTAIDFDNTVLKTADVPAVFDDEQFTQEFQISYGGNGINAVGGAYYYTGDACGLFDLQAEMLAQALSLPGYTQQVSGCTDTESYSGYGQSTIKLSNQWSMTIGGRYTQDTKSADVSNFTFFQTVYPGESESGSVTPVNPDNYFTNEETWSHFSPRVGAEYQYSEDLMYYFSYANGFKSGGFNPRGDLGKDPEAALPFDPEIVDTFEFGFKSEPTDDLRVNATYFFSDYSDMQVTVQRAVENSFAAKVVNAGAAEIQGLELESTYAASDNLTLNLGVGYIDAEFIDFIDVDPDSGEFVNRANEKGISNTPDWSINLGANYILVADIGDIVFTANAAYRGETQIFEDPSALDQEGYTLVNIGVNFYHSDGHWSASLQGKNVFNEQVIIAGYNFPLPNGLLGEDAMIGYYNAPSTLAFTIKYEF